MKKIRLVDDDAVIVAVYRNKLVQAGFDVAVASDGLVAMKSELTVTHANAATGASGF